MRNAGTTKLTYVYRFGGGGEKLVCTTAYTHTHNPRHDT